MLAAKMDQDQLTSTMKAPRRKITTSQSVASKGRCSKISNCLKRMPLIIMKLMKNQIS